MSLKLVLSESREAAIDERSFGAIWLAFVAVVWSDVIELEVAAES